MNIFISWPPPPQKRSMQHEGSKPVLTVFLKILETRHRSHQKHMVSQVMSRSFHGAMISILPGKEGKELNTGDIPPWAEVEPWGGSNQLPNMWPCRRDLGGVNSDFVKKTVWDLVLMVDQLWCWSFFVGGDTVPCEAQDQCGRPFDCHSAQD